MLRFQIDDYTAYVHPDPIECGSVLQSLRIAQFLRYDYIWDSATESHIRVDALEFFPNDAVNIDAITKLENLLSEAEYTANVYRDNVDRFDDDETVQLWNDACDARNAYANVLHSVNAIRAILAV